ncbi:Late embryoproteinsis abundant protein D-29 [Hibiscus syriacus]|uniref:non-specific serine/threonine protein kinase n=1 Tax=Hibiscus syriacus TaxID=106335 RepID=A0A6A3CRB6_HIBSY|nr:Late embryoproteinsis abundant protein D-29 [Hibiscus syriacus]
MFSKGVPVWFFILSTVLIATSVVRCTSVGHTPSTDDDAKDYSRLKANTEEATDEINRQTQQAKDELKSRTQKATDTASDVRKEAKESTESWTGWAKDKISEGLGFKQDDAMDSIKRTSDSAADTATKAKDKFNDITSGAGEYSAGKAKDMKDSAYKTTEDTEKAKDIADTTSEMTNEAKERAARRGEEAKEKAADEAEKRKAQTESLSWAKEKAKEGYDAAKNKAGETMEAAKESIASSYKSEKQKSQEMKDNYVNGGGHQTRDKDKNKKRLEIAKPTDLVILSFLQHFDTANGNSENGELRAGEDARRGKFRRSITIIHGAASEIWSCGVILFSILAGYFRFDDTNLAVLFHKVSKTVMKMPKGLSPGAWDLIRRMLDPNPKTRIKMADIKDDEWFKQDYIPAVQYDEEEDIYIDEEAFSMSEMGSDGSRSPEAPSRINAFQLTGMSSSLDLSGFFEQEEDQIYTSNHSAKNLLARIKDTVTEKGFRVQTKNGRLKATQEQNGQTFLGSRLSITAEVFEISSSLHVVELRKSYGDSTFYRQLCRKLSNELGIPQSQRIIGYKILCHGGFPQPSSPSLLDFFGSRLSAGTITALDCWFSGHTRVDWPSWA